MSRRKPAKPDMVKVTVDTGGAPPPPWARAQRELILELERAAEEFVARYTRSDRTLIWRDNWPGMDGSDDPYEAFQNLVLLYALGGSPRMLELGEQMWEAITWQWTQYGQISGEFDRYYDWMHHGESSHLLYFTGLARPESLRWKQRAVTFADLYAGDAAAGVNYDPVHRIIRSPITGSSGPRFQLTAEDWLTHRPLLKDVPFDDLENAEGLPYPWLDDEVFEGVLSRFNQRITRGDVPVNLNATSLVTHAYLFSGVGRYRDWVTDYVGAWHERTIRNGGITPDNVGLSGQVGEYNDGNWWGGYYGWRWPRGFKDVLESITVGSSNALLVSGDRAHLDLPRSLIDTLWELRERDPDTGAWRLPSKHSAAGWFDYRIPPVAPLVQLWSVSLDDDDAARVEQFQFPDAWSEIYLPRTSGYDPARNQETKHLIANTLPWFRFMRGDFPDYPERILAANAETVHRQLVRMRSSEGDPHNWDLDHPYSIHMWQEMCPVVIESLVQLMFGSPMHISHGGMQQAQVRYFDADGRRPGLPAGVSALVRSVRKDAVVLVLANVDLLSRRVIVQAGAAGEHEVISVTARDGSAAGVRISPSPSTTSQVAVSLPAGASVTLEVGLRRYARTPSYRTPWTDPHDTHLIRPRDLEHTGTPDARPLTDVGADGPPTIYPQRRRG